MRMQHFGGTRGTKALMSTALALLIGAAVVRPLMAAETTVLARTQHGPESVADLAESITDAVVNIAITQNVKPEGDEGFPSPNLPDDAPLKDLFDDYFKDKGNDGASSARKPLGGLP
eukprot:gene5645-7661_t